MNTKLNCGSAVGSSPCLLRHAEPKQHCAISPSNTSCAWWNSMAKNRFGERGPEKGAWVQFRSPKWRNSRQARLFSVCNPPDRAVSVFRHKERAVMRDRHSNGSSPHVGIIDDEAGEKILVFAGRRSIFQRNSDDFIAGSFGSVPRSMFCCESITRKFGRKHFAVVKRQAQRGRMGLDQNIGSGDLAL